MAIDTDPGAGPDPRLERWARVRAPRALARVVRQVGGGDGASHSLATRRQMVAGWCRMLGQQPKGQGNGALAASAPVVATPKLPPRLRQTLEHLLQGDGEKQIAHKLGLSPHTVHVYVKSLHKRFNVSSRAELLARFIRPGAAAAPPPVS